MERFSSPTSPTRCVFPCRARNRRRLVVNAARNCFAIPRLPLAREYPDVGAAEGSVAERITNRIDGGVEITKGVEEVPQLLGDTFRARRYRLQKHQDVVPGSGKEGRNVSERRRRKIDLRLRRPGDDEGEKDGGQGLGCLRLLPLLLGLFLLLQGRLLLLLLPRCQHRLSRNYFGI